MGVMLPLNEGTSEWLEELARSTGNVVAQVWRVQLLANQACWGVPGGRLCQSSDLGSAELGDAPKIHTQDPPPILLLQWEEVRSMKLKSREVVPQEPTPPSVSEAQGAPTSGDTPSPPSFLRSMRITLWFPGWTCLLTRILSAPNGYGK